MKNGKGQGSGRNDVAFSILETQYANMRERHEQTFRFEMPAHLHARACTRLAAELCVCFGQTGVLRTFNQISPVAPLLTRFAPLWQASVPWRFVVGLSSRYTALRSPFQRAGARSCVFAC